MYIRTIFQSFLQALVSHINSISTSSSDAVRLIPSERVNRFSCSRLVIIMNGMNGIPALWQEARNTDGRIYYYNVQTKATQWTKPFELMTPAEVSIFFSRIYQLLIVLQRALANQPWKEYTAAGGRKYWYNTETRQSTWEMPEVYRTALATPPQVSTRPIQP